MRNIVKTSAKIGQLLKKYGNTVTTAESCTGGGISYFLTQISGSSAWFERGFVTYSNQAKMDMLLVSNDRLLAFGAVSEEVVFEMAKGALNAANADYAVAVSGIAGPLGGSEEKPVGTVCFAWASAQEIICETRVFEGGREAVRTCTIAHALDRLLSIVKSEKRAL